MCQIVLEMLNHLYRILFNNSKEIKNTEKLGAEDMIEKITVMEGKITQLEEQNKNLQKQLEYNRNKEAALQKVLCNYDNLLKKVIMEKNMSTQDNETTLHLANLESAFYDLLQKYEKAKLIVAGFQENESLLKNQMKEYEAILESLRGKVVAYKSISQIKKGSAKNIKNCGDSKQKRRLLPSV